MLISFLARLHTYCMHFICIMQSYSSVFTCKVLESGDLSLWFHLERPAEKKAGVRQQQRLLLELPAWI